MQRHPRRARLPQRLRPARRPGDWPAGAAGVGRMGDGGSPCGRRRADHGRRAAARSGIRDRGLLSASRTTRRGAASRPRSGATSRISTAAARGRGTSTGCACRSGTSRAS
jgi:hypothetical protein